MNLERIQKSLYWAIMASETSHIFCCVLPTLFSVMSLLAGLGLAVAMPAGMENLHAMLHEWEIPMIIVSGVVVALGWLVYHISVKLDCRDTGCVHEPCVPRKKKSGNILKFATILFLFNVTVFLFFHHGLDHLMHF